MDKDAYIAMLEQQNEELREKLGQAEHVIQLSNAHNSITIYKTLEAIRESCDDHEQYDLHCKLVATFLHLNPYGFTLKYDRELWYEDIPDIEGKEKRYSVVITLLGETIDCKSFFIFPTKKYQEKIKVTICQFGATQSFDYVFEEPLIKRFKEVCQDKRDVDNANREAMVYR